MVWPCVARGIGRAGGGPVQSPGELLLHDVWSIMKERGLLHVPVVGEDSKPLGVINARDAPLALLEDSEYQEALPRDYVMGTGYR